VTKNRSSGTAIRGVWPAALVLGLVALVYLPALSNGFVYDDSTVLPGITNFLARPGPLHRFVSTDYFFSNELTYRPIVTLTYLIDWRAGGGPFVFHLQNLLWHLVAVGCLLVVLQRIGTSALVRYVTATIYGVHPVLTEAVDAIAFREDVLVTAFGLLGIVLSTGQTRRPGTVRLLAATACFAAAMLSKESGVVFVALLPLTHWAIARQSDPPAPWRPRTYRREYVYLAACTAAYLVVRFVLLPSPVQYAARVGSLADSLCTGIVALANYVRISVYPYPLCADYRGVMPWVTSMSDWRIWVSLALGAGLTVAAFRRRLRSPLVFWGWMWFLVSLAPVLHVVALPAPMAERFLHLPLVGLVAFGVGLASSIHLSRPVAIGAAAMVVAPFCALTWSRHAAWSSNDVLWQTTLASYPTSFAALHSYGSALAQANRASDAIPYLKRALENTTVGPDARAAVLLDLGSAYFSMSRFTEAKEMFEQSAAAAPSAKAYDNLGLACVRLGRFDEAAEYLRSALRMDPGMADAHSSLGGVLAAQGKNADAIGEYEQAIRLDPGLAFAHANLGLALAAQNRTDESIEAFRRAIDLEPRQVHWRYMLATMLARRGDRNLAIEQLTAALRIDPNFEQARAGLKALGAN
jgi:tetratricopeptide (TPR) repeat protein